MPRNNNTAKRKDSKGRVLRTGESQRKDGTYDFRYMDSNHKRRSIYAMTLEDLRRKEDELTTCKTMGAEDCTTVEDLRKKEAEAMICVEMCRFLYATKFCNSANSEYNELCRPIKGIFT